jgi:hypothetical protein
MWAMLYDDFYTLARCLVRSKCANAHHTATSSRQISRYRATFWNVHCAVLRLHSKYGRLRAPIYWLICSAVAGSGCTVSVRALRTYYTASASIKVIQLPDQTYWYLIRKFERYLVCSSIGILVKLPSKTSIFPDQKF